MGPNASTPVIGEVTVHVSNPTLHPTPLALGEESAYAEMDEGDEASARNCSATCGPHAAIRCPISTGP